MYLEISSIVNLIHAINGSCAQVCKVGLRSFHHLTYQVLLLNFAPIANKNSYTAHDFHFLLAIGWKTDGMT